MFYVMFMVLLLVAVVYFLFFLIFYKIKQNSEMISSYECGFEPKSLTRLAFSYRFFLISILFLIFDVEIVLLLPVPYLLNIVESLWLMLSFIMILVVGLLYEYYCGSLEWLNNFVSKA